ncbi:LexA family transcriptional regulator [Flavobacterium psychrophilum]|nr:LexA family transcriptional regulator [Flavobacterium psychrophilum]EKT4510507.1 LexA family transcriptional regulator [Flavobacterium psychrophilum]
MYNFDIIRVKNLLKAGKINIGDLADKSGIKRATLYNYLSESTPITVDALISISNACNINLSEIISNSNKLEFDKIEEDKKYNKNYNISDTKPNIHENEAMNLTQSHATIGLNAKIKGNKSIMSGFSIEKVRELDPLGNYEPIPLVFHEAVAGFGGSAFSLQEHDIQAFYTVPDFKKIDFMIRINGSSMYPKYNSGDVIAVRVLHEKAFIQWNKVHLIATKEQGLLVKRLKKSTNDDNIICASDNKEYDAFEVPWKEIEGVALVIGVIRLE